mmetsp:Transcript_40852/g.89375  ORF Transcript_40852/g.89375 Transcript_40852/m.89375 type:complete len:820 (-) Transcript_40852:221-2680(-)
MLWPGKHLALLLAWCLALHVRAAPQAALRGEGAESKLGNPLGHVIEADLVDEESLSSDTWNGTSSGTWNDTWNGTWNETGNETGNETLNGSLINSSNVVGEGDNSTSMTGMTSTNASVPDEAAEKKAHANKAIGTSGEHESLMRPIGMKDVEPTEEEPEAETTEPPDQNTTLPESGSNSSLAVVNGSAAGGQESTTEAPGETTSASGQGQSVPAEEPGSSPGPAGNTEPQHTGAPGVIEPGMSSATTSSASGSSATSTTMTSVTTTTSTTTTSTTSLSEDSERSPGEHEAMDVVIDVHPERNASKKNPEIETTAPPIPVLNNIPPSIHSDGEEGEQFQRVKRDDSWETSPYVSQERLDNLWEYLFRDYDRQVPPVPENGGPLPVGIGINFVKFKDFDEVSGTMNIALNLRLCWGDERLGFNAMDFFNMSWSHEGDKVPIRSDRVWTPDVTVLNEVGGIGKLLAATGTPLVLADKEFMNETGVNILWSRPLDVKSNCEVDMSHYPFDVQTCYIIVGSWASSLRQMRLVPQPFFAEFSVHTSEFHVKDITVSERSVKTKGTGQRFSEVVYCVVLKRYPHYYVINFILPMVAITLMTISTMWMSPGNVGPRVNSGTKLLLCVVSIIFVTARSRPRVHGDIWMDRFQSHCLALSMSSVLESLFVDYLSKASAHFPIATGRLHEIMDSLLRASICFVTAAVMYTDAQSVENFSEVGSVDGSGAVTLYASFGSHSTRLLVAFVYTIFTGLIASSVLSLAFIMAPSRWRRQLLRKTGEDAGPMIAMASVGDVGGCFGGDRQTSAESVTRYRPVSTDSREQPSDGVV